MDTKTIPLPSAAPGTAPAATPMAGIGAAVQPSATPVSPSASATAPLFGGLRGGRKRKDGLTPGTAEAIAADREKDRLRKEEQRKRERAAVEPAALPSAAPGVAGQASAPDDSLGAVPGAVAGAPIPWDAGTLAPLFKQLLPTVEAVTVATIGGRAVKARLPGELVKEIESAAAWPEPAKKALEISGPQLAAKWLNRSGISAECQPEVVFITALGSVLAGQVMVLRRLDEIIAKNGVAAVKPAPAAAGVKP